MHPSGPVHFNPFTHYIDTGKKCLSEFMLEQLMAALLDIKIPIFKIFACMYLDPYCSSPKIVFFEWT